MLMVDCDVIYTYHVSIFVKLRVKTHDANVHACRSKNGGPETDRELDNGVPSATSVHCGQH